MSQPPENMTRRRMAARRRAARKRMYARRRRTVLLGLLLFGATFGARAFLIDEPELARTGLQPGLPTATAEPTRTTPVEGKDPLFPIKHVVFIVKENRTFDNYFARYPGAEGTKT